MSRKNNKKIKRRYHEYLKRHENELDKQKEVRKVKK